MWMLFVDDIVLRDRRQGDRVGFLWHQVCWHGPALGCRDFYLLPSLRIHDKVPRRKYLQRADRLYVREVVVHVDLSCDLFLHDFYSMLLYHFSCPRWPYSLCHICLML